MYWRFTPAVELPCFSWPVSSSAPTVIRLRRDRRAASSSPAAAYLLTRLIAARSSHEALFSSRWDVPGDLSPAYWATDHPFRDGRSLASAFRYFPTCSHVCVRTKQVRSSPIRAARSRSARLTPIPAAAAALCSFVLTSNMVEGGRVHAARFRADAAYLRTGSPALRAAGTGTSRSGGRPALA